MHLLIFAEFVRFWWQNTHKPLAGTDNICPPLMVYQNTTGIVNEPTRHRVFKQHCHNRQGAAITLSQQSAFGDNLPIISLNSIISWLCDDSVTTMLRLWEKTVYFSTYITIITYMPCASVPTTRALYILVWSYLPLSLCHHHYSQHSKEE